ncbi:hypothetical protein WJX73_004398 [Symbiochloris irregularis]|uniref:Protein kinase domain-containing protein n=1 Tax=Symbiochloris irregularis TaxID=706552 RepID=A0AAW1NRR6_9CHLO
MVCHEDAVTLEEHIVSRKRLSDREVLTLLLRLVEPLVHMHANGTIHKDLKPLGLALSTMMRMFKGFKSLLIIMNSAKPLVQGMTIYDNCKIIVIDFGIALFVGTSWSKYHSRSGTPHMSAPEAQDNAPKVRVTGAEQLGHRAEHMPYDMHSMGLILDFLSTGHYTFASVPDADTEDSSDSNDSDDDRSRDQRLLEYGWLPDPLAVKAPGAPRRDPIFRALTTNLLCRRPSLRMTAPQVASAEQLYPYKAMLELQELKADLQGLQVLHRADAATLAQALQAGSAGLNAEEAEHEAAAIQNLVARLPAPVQKTEQRRSRRLQNVPAGQEQLQSVAASAGAAAAPVNSAAQGLSTLNLNPPEPPSSSAAGASGTGETGTATSSATASGGESLTTDSSGVVWWTCACGEKVRNTSRNSIDAHLKRCPQAQAQEELKSRNAARKARATKQLSSHTRSRR